jgi:hypothetical protein
VATVEFHNLPSPVAANITELEVLDESVRRRACLLPFLTKTFFGDIPFVIIGNVCLEHH